MSLHSFLKFFALILIPVLIVSFDFKQTYDSNPYEKYSEVNIKLNKPEDVQRLQMAGVTVDHYTGDIETGINLTINRNELHRLENTGLDYTITIPDTDEYYKNRQEPSIQELNASYDIMKKDGVEGFELGAMGGFYTYTQVVQELDSFRLQYPNLITVKQNIGTSIEGRTIWMVKISDNPDVNESSTEPAVYFDALHHAREPISMASLMYYINYLLDNYSTNAEVSHLVNNREIFIVPVVNPDGYVYNQTTNPNGGGQWRKNRKNNGGNCFGVDLNRNYSYGWGVNSGSSNDPCSDTYRGTAFNSELESQAIVNLVNQINPKIAFSVHSVAGRYLNPYGYTDTAVSYEVYSEFSGDFAPSNNYLYGTVIEMLSYYSSGTTRDYLHSRGTYCWTPELGGSSFWPASNTIIGTCSENIYSYNYLTWVSGSFADFQSYKLLGKGWGYRGDTVSMQIDVKNKGLSKTSKNVIVTLNQLSGLISPIVSFSNIDSIPARTIRNNSANPLKFIVSNSANPGDEVKLVITTTEQGVVSSRDTVSFYVGAADVKFSDNAENGTSKWTKTGTGLMWDSSYVASYTGTKSFADSRYGNSRNSTNNVFLLNDTINLTNTVNPRIEFDLKYAIETNSDYARISVSSNFGSTWTNLSGKHTTTVSGQPSYTRIKSWVNEQINLSAYIGQRIRIRFTYFTNSSVPGDGLYVDNFRVLDYKTQLTDIKSVSDILPGKFELSQNFPNPFNPVTNIEFSIPSGIKSGITKVSLNIFDISGKLVATLINSDLTPGKYSIKWNAENFASGTYFYKLKTEDFLQIKKLVLLK